MSLTVATALKKVFSKPTGREKSINDVIFYGVGDTPYAYTSDLKKAKCRFKKGKNSTFGHPAKANMKKLLEYLLKTDGYLR